MKLSSVAECLMRGAIFAGLAWAGYPTVAVGLLAIATWPMDKAIERNHHEIQSVKGLLLPPSGGLSEVN